MKSILLSMFLAGSPCLHATDFSQKWPATLNQSVFQVSEHEDPSDDFDSFTQKETGFTLSLPIDWQQLNRETSEILKFTGPEDSSLTVELVEQDEYMISQKSSPSGLPYFVMLGNNQFHIFPFSEPEDQGLIAYLHPQDKMFKLTFHGSKLETSIIWQILSSVQMHQIEKKKHVENLV